MAASDYMDVNQDFFRECFDRALPYTPYLENSPEEHRAKWDAAWELTELTSEQLRLLESFTRKINMLVLSGVWCGDCVRQGPIFGRIAEACSTLDLRFVERDQEPKLADMLRINGALKVPVALMLSEDFFEISRTGDRPLSVYRRKAAQDIGPSCDTGLIPPEEKELSTEIAEWMAEVERVQLILRTSPMLRKRYGD